MSKNSNTEGKTSVEIEADFRFHFKHKVSKKRAALLAAALTLAGILYEISVRADIFINVHPPAETTSRQLPSPREKGRPQTERRHRREDCGCGAHGVKTPPKPHPKHGRKASALKP
jgi:hypothetical protein